MVTFRVPAVFLAASLVLAQTSDQRGSVLIQDQTHQSQVMGEARHFRIFLPPDYASATTKRYPVIYWFHGFGERYNEPSTKERNYDSGEAYGGDTIASYVQSHDVIVVKWDGFNPRYPNEKYKRPYNIGPVETNRQFPLYFPELVDYIDANYRTIADRAHRAVTGFSMGGFMSYWIAGKYPHLVSSASAFMPSSEFTVGPKGFDIEYRHDEMADNYDGVRTRLIMGTKDFIQFYHRQMNAVWKYARSNHEVEEFDSDHGTPGIAATFDFHMKGFSAPLPKPLVWSHTDAYQVFSVWGWDVISNRREPGFTVLSNVSKAGFHSQVREWLPGGRVLNKVRMTVITDKLYPPKKAQIVTIIRLRDGKVMRSPVEADGDGRLAIELDGDAYEVGIGPAGVLALSGYELSGMPWATAGQLVKARVRFWNKGEAPIPQTTLRWETANPDVAFETPKAAVPPLAPGKFIDLPLALTVKDETRKVVKIMAVNQAERFPLTIPLLPPAAPADSDLKVADGVALNIFQHGVDKQEMRFGEGNGDGAVNAGESFALLFWDKDAYRASELFTNDPCVDLTTRVSDDWASYDHVGASAKYSVPAISKTCPVGHVIPVMARVVKPNKPNHEVEYHTVMLQVQ